MSNIDIIGLGACTVDVLSLVEHLPTEDENMRALEISVQGGGPVATALVAAARLGAHTAMLDSIGDDWRGNVIVGEFEQEGVETRYLKQGSGWTSPTSCILVKKDNGARSIVWAPGTAEELRPEELPRAVFQAAKMLHCNGRHFAACMQAARLARETGARVSFDGGAGRYREELRALVPLSDICIVARDFAEKYTGTADNAAAAQTFLQSGPSIVVITEGIRGSRVYARDGKAFHQPAYLMPHVVDTTGCGDGYHGAFLFGLLQGLPLEQTAALASAVAAMNSQRLGGRAGLPTYGQAAEFLLQRGDPIVNK